MPLSRFINAATRIHLKPSAKDVSGRLRWPINRHSVFVHGCRLSNMDRTLCAATSLTGQRLWMAGCSI